MQCLGPSIADLVEFCGGTLSAKSSLLVAKQMIDRLEQLHANRVIHEDIKPQNATIGLGDQSNHIYMIDFGISEYF